MRNKELTIKNVCSSDNAGDSVERHEQKIKNKIAEVWGE